MADKKFPTDYTDEIIEPDNNDKFMITDNSVGEALKQIKWGSIAANINTINDIINGIMNIWQRNTTFTSASSGQHSADRFKYIKVGTMVHNLLRSTDKPNNNFAYSLLVDCTTAQTSLGATDATTIDYHVEGYNYRKYVDHFGTLSFWVKSSKTGVHCVSFNNSGLDRSYVVEYTINTVDTWEYKVVTVLFNEIGGTWNYTNGTGIRIRWVLAAGTSFQTTPNVWQSSGNFFSTTNQVNLCDSTSNNFRITGITFNIGKYPISFHNYSYEKELIRCQRYYEKSYDIGVFPGTITNVGNDEYVDDTGTSEIFARTTVYTIRKRAAPTLTSYSPATGTSGKCESVSGDQNTSFANVGERSFKLINNGLKEQVLRWQWTADAEL